MHQEYTDRVKEIMRLARSICLELGNDSVSIDHILLGMIREANGSGVAVLRHQQVDIEKLDQAIRTQIAGSCEVALWDVIPFSPRAKALIDIAGKEAIDSGRSRIGTEHFLLAILCDAESVGAGLLAAMGVDRNACRETLVNELYAAEASDGSSTATPASPTAPEPDATDKIRDLRRKPHNMLSGDEIETLVTWVLVDHLIAQECDLVPEATLDSLGLDSIDIVEAMMKLEDEFNIEIDDDEIVSLKTLQDVLDFIKRQLQDPR